MKRIAAERLLIGISQEKLAMHLGTTKQTIYRWENGLANPRLPDLCNMAAFFGCTTDWLLGRSESRK